MNEDGKGEPGAHPSLGSQEVEVDEEGQQYHDAQSVDERSSPEGPHGVDIARCPQQCCGERGVVRRNRGIEVSRKRHDHGREADVANVGVAIDLVRTGTDGVGGGGFTRYRGDRRVGLL